MTWLLWRRYLFSIIVAVKFLIGISMMNPSAYVYWRGVASLKAFFAIMPPTLWGALFLWCGVAILYGMRDMGAARLGLVILSWIWWTLLGCYFFSALEAGTTTFVGVILYLIIALFHTIFAAIPSRG